MRILVTGSRDWDDFVFVSQAIMNEVIACADRNGIPPGRPTDYVTIVHGACPTGIDKNADQTATWLNWKVERHPADWKLHGKAAGFRRNAEMVNLGADVCLAFIKNNSKGASHTRDLAHKAGIKVVEYRAD